MKTRAIFAFLLAVSASFSPAQDGVAPLDQPRPPRRDLTLIAKPDAFPPSPAKLASMRLRVLQAQQAAAIARSAAIEARTRALNEQRDSALRREKQVGDALNPTRP